MEPSAPTPAIPPTVNQPFSPASSSLPPQRSKNWVAEIIIIVVVLVLLGTLVAIILMNRSKPSKTASRTTSVSSASSGTPFSNAAAGITATIPTNWHEQTVAGTLFAFLEPTTAGQTFIGNINLVLDPSVTSTMTLNTYYASSKVAISNFTNFHLLNEFNTNIAGVPARAIVYTATTQNKALKFEQVLFITHSHGYVLTLTTLPNLFSNYQTPFITVVDSLKVN
jgi:hypothetical protein